MLRRPTPHSLLLGLLGAGLALAQAGCAGSPTADEPANGDADAEVVEGEATPDRDPAPEPQPAQPAATLGTLESPDDPANLRCLKLVEQVTGKTFTRHVPVYVYTPEELEQELATWGDYQPENILGFYKFDTKALYLVPKKAGNRRAFGLRLHEATHALQDQLYDLKTVHEAQDTTDSDYAVLALIEGEAVMVMVDALIATQPAVAHIAKIRAPKGSTDPNAFRRVYTYAYGTVFIEHLKRRGGYDAVHEAFSRLPVSTEQVIHPEKYDTALDLPDHIDPKATAAAVKALLPKGYAVSKVDRLGEFETRLLFVGALPDEAEAIAAGWGGDVTISATRDTQTLTLRLTTWDSAADAEQFLAAAAKLTDVRAAVLSKERRVVVIQCSEAMDEATLTALVTALQNVPVDLEPEQRR